MSNFHFLKKVLIYYFKIFSDFFPKNIIHACEQFMCHGYIEKNTAQHKKKPGKMILFGNFWIFSYFKK